MFKKIDDEILQYRMALMHLSKLVTEGDKSYLQTEDTTRFISTDDLWKLGVDARDHQFGRLAYDEGKNTSKCAENGYIDAMETAIAFNFRTLSLPLTPTLIKRLHYLCCFNVKLSSGLSYCRSISDEYKEAQGNQFTAGRGRCPLRNKKIITKEGLSEMLDFPGMKFALYDNGDYFELARENLDKTFQLIQEGKCGGECGIEGNREAKHSLVQSYIDDYEKSVKLATSDDEKIHAIAVLAKKIETAHFFSDGNLRTVRLIILKLLAQNNLPLTCIVDPNIIDGHSSLQVADSIKQGMLTYHQLEEKIADKSRLQFGCRIS